MIDESFRNDLHSLVNDFNALAGFSRHINLFKMAKPQMIRIYRDIGNQMAIKKIDLPRKITQKEDDALQRNDLRKQCISLHVDQKHEYECVYIP